MSSEVEVRRVVWAFVAIRPSSRGAAAVRLSRWITATRAAVKAIQVTFAKVWLP